MAPPKKKTTTTREKRKTPTKAKATKAKTTKSTTTPTKTTTTIRRKARRGSGGSTTSKTSKSSPSSSRAPTPTPTLLPPSLQGRALPTLLLDSGGWTIKHRLLTPNTSHNTIIPPNKSYNVIAKPKHVLTTLVANDINSIQNKANLIVKRPLERGYTTDLGVQLPIWEWILQNEGLDYRHSFANPNIIAAAGGGTTNNVNSNALIEGKSSQLTHTAAVVCLHQPFTPRSILEKEDEIWFRDFGFGRLQRRLGVCCSALRYLKLAKDMRKIWENSDSNQNMENDSINSDTIQKRKEKCINEFGFVVKDDETECCCVIDSGFSLTHIVPTVKARAISKAIRRINIGGKLLTNLLKETLSYRQFNMMDEYYNVNDAKESLCYISTNFEEDMRYARSVETRVGCRRWDREFVLPDYVSCSKGRVRVPLRLQMLMEEEKRKKEEMAEAQIEEAMLVEDGEECNTNNDAAAENPEKNNMEPSNNEDDNNHDIDSEDETDDQKRHRILLQKQQEQLRREQEAQDQQALLLSIERFTIPEILFRPSDIELKTLGLAEAIVSSIQASEDIYHAAMYHNIILTGGNAKIPNLKERLEKELRALAPIEYKIRINVPKDPTTFAFEGAQDMVKKDGFVCGVDRAEWEGRKQAGNVGDLWNNGNSDGLEDGFIVI